MSPPEAGKILELLQKKIKLMEDLLSYAGQQSKLSYIDNPVNYGNIVESRKIVIEEIKKLDIVLQRSLEPVKNSEWENEIEARINEANVQINALAKQIISLDERSKAMMINELRKVKSKMSALQKGKKGVKGYDARNNFNQAGAYTDSKR